LKIALVTLLAAGLALTWALVTETTKNNQLQSQVTELTTKLGDKKTRESLDLQRNCAQQAEKIFHQLGYNLNPTGSNIAVYQNHYNAKLNKCFMVLTATAMKVTAYGEKHLFDAYEQREYGEYIWQSSKLTPYSDEVLSCRLSDPSKAEANCKTKQEFDAFAARYME
jgi:hypothetical protein